jgi:MurNAc alpha-1-phosphate uridylyltransferase
MSQMTQAVILAAGMGSRLKSFTQNKPKALMPIAGESAIVRIIRKLVASGIHDIAINLHHHANQIQQTLGHGGRFNARLYYSYEDTLLDSGGGVRTAIDLLPSDNGLIVHNCDIMSDIDFSHLAHLCPQHGCALALVRNPYHNPEGDFSLDDQHVRPKLKHNFTFSGVSAWDKDALLAYDNHQPFSLIQPIQQAISEQRCFGDLHRGYWFDIGRPHDWVQANRFYQKAYL